MVKLEDVRKMLLAMADVTEGTRWGNQTYLVNENAFAWERPLNKADLKRFGDETPPEGPFLALRTADLMEKEAALEANPDAFFTIEHFKCYPAYLVKLNEVSKKVLKTAIEDAWRTAKAKPAAKPRTKAKSAAKPKTKAKPTTKTAATKSRRRA